MKKQHLGLKKIVNPKSGDSLYLLFDEYKSYYHVLPTNNDIFEQLASTVPDLLSEDLERETTIELEAPILSNKKIPIQPSAPQQVPLDFAKIEAEIEAKRKNLAIKKPDKKKIFKKILSGLLLCLFYAFIFLFFLFIFNFILAI